MEASPNDLYHKLWAQSEAISALTLHYPSLNGSGNYVCKVSHLAPDQTYHSARSYAAAMIDFHDQRLLAQPNAVFNEDDCLFQMATHAVFRLHADRFVGEEHNHGPVVLQLTNLHAGNTFVDGNWNIACLINPEWVCSLPVDSFRVPFWLTEGSTDQVCGKGHHAYNEVRQEFMAAWAGVEREMGNSHDFALS